MASLSTHPIISMFNSSSCLSRARNSTQLSLLCALWTHRALRAVGLDYSSPVSCHLVAR